jgi:hypothetical protein
MFVKILYHLHPEIIKLSEDVKLLDREGYDSGAEFRGFGLHNDGVIWVLGVPEMQELAQ